MSPSARGLSILLYIPTLSGGGAETLFVTLANGLAARGCDVCLAIDFPPTLQPPALDGRVEVVTVGRSHAKAVAGLASLIRTRRFDATMSGIGANNLKHWLAAAGAGRLGHAVLSCHAFFENEPERLSSLANRLTFLTSRTAARTVCVSNGLKADVIGRWKASPARTLAIHNPVDAPVAAQLTEPHLRVRAPMVMAAGRLAPVKNYALLIEAFARLEDPAATLVIYGEGAERQALEALVARYGLAGRVSLPGFVPSLAPCLAQARCFVVSSRSESFGNVVVEALAAGLPVVSTRCGGPEEILSGDLGRLVPTDDPKALAGAMAEALREPGDPVPRLRRALDFSLDRALDRYLSLFLSLADPAGRRQRTPDGD